MHRTQQILSDIVIHNKYAKYISLDNRRESWDEIVERYISMMIKNYPSLEDEIIANGSYLLEKKVLMSMRAAQFAGAAIEKNNSRVYNCAYMPVDHYKSFSEAMFLLLGGTGLGYSVQFSHVNKLPEIRKPKKSQKYVIEDSIEGWADAIKHLMKSYFGMRETKPRFDFSSIRPKGARLITAGGKAPGSQPLMKCLYNIELELEAKEDGSKLTPIEAHSIMCRIADAVLAGGIRRAALIALFSADDVSMMEAKSGSWWELNPHFGRANNTAVLLRHRVSKKFFFDLWKRVEASRAGEPGIMFSNDREMGVNPCQPEDATLLSPEGIITMGAVKEGDTIWSGKEWTKVLSKWSTGVQPVYKYNTTTGYFLGTENHKVVENGKKIKVKDANSIDWCIGDSSKLTWQFDLQSVMDGLIIGDGGVHKASNNLVVLYIGKKDSDYFTSDISSQLKKERKGISPYAWEAETTITSDELPRTFDRSVPDRFFYGNEKTKRSFLRGLFSANGSLCYDRVTLKQTSRNLIEQVREMLSSLGINSYITTNKSKLNVFPNGEYRMKESYDINITSGRTAFKDKIGFIQRYKQDKVINGCNAKYKTSEIRDVEFIDYKEVFDISVAADSHTYWTGGVLVSNCFEVSLRPYSFCNLTEINSGDLRSQGEFNDRARIASFFGTLQSGITDFHYLRQIWQTTTEKDSLIGVGQTGICNGAVLKLDQKEAVGEALKENERIADLIGINKAARVSVIKPSGTTSLVLGVSSGIHAWHSRYYIRNIQCSVGDELHTYFTKNHPELIKVMDLDSSSAVIGIPQKAPLNAILRDDEGAIEMLNRVKFVYDKWVKPGHRSGDNTNNVSATVYIKDSEWEDVGEWLWENRYEMNGVSCLPYDGGSYVDAPFQECTRSFYDDKLQYIDDIDIDKITELEDNTTLSGELACAGAACEI